MSDPEPLAPAALKRRARRLAAAGDYAGAAAALRRVADSTQQAAAFVALGDMYRRARRTPEALRALRYGMHLHHRAGAASRARTVARMIALLDPWGAVARPALVS